MHTYLSCFVFLKTSFKKKFGSFLKLFLSLHDPRINSIFTERSYLGDFLKKIAQCSEINWYQYDRTAIWTTVSYVHCTHMDGTWKKGSQPLSPICSKESSCPHLLPWLGFFSIMSSMNREFLSNFQSALAEMSVQPHFYHYHQNLLC